MKQVLACINYCHQHKIVHRDLKPSNVIWLARRNRWTVIDFGCVAPIGAKCRPAYSLPYVAPETLRAHGASKAVTASVATDAWSLGVMFFELLTGRQWYKLIEDRKLVRIHDIHAWFRAASISPSVFQAQFLCK